MTLAAAQPQEKAKPAPFQIVQSKASDRYLKVLIYGPYGAGKTTLASTASDVAEMGDVLYVDAESGALSLPDGLDVIRIKDYKTLARIFEFLKLHVRLRDGDKEDELQKLQERVGLTGRVRKYRTVVIDSLTEAQTYLMYQLLNVPLDNWALDLTPESPEYKEWGQSSEMIQLLVRTFRDLPMNVIFVCSEQEVEDNKRLIKRPNLPGKLAGKVQGFLDVVGYLDTAVDGEGGTRRRLWLQPGHQRFQAKHRFRNASVQYIDDPTMADLHSLTKESPSGKPSSKPKQQSEDGDSASTEASREGTRAAGGSGTGGRAVRRGPVRSAGPVRRTG